MSKSFKTAPTPPRQPTSDQILAFVAGGQKAPVAAAGPVAVVEKIPTARLSLDISADLHSRFKAACARSRLKMTAELLAFIEARTAELEGKR